MSTHQDPPITISGGSVTIEFDSETFGEMAPGVYSNREKVIKRVEVIGADIENYDASATGSDITIKITYGNP